MLLFFIVAIIIVAFILFQIADSLFYEEYMRFISICYLVAIWLFIIFLMTPYFYPSMIGYESWGYFLIYSPLFALMYLLPALLSVAAAHIACKIRYKENSAKISNKLLWAAIIVFLVSLFILPFLIIGICFIIIVSIHKAVYFISQKIKQQKIIIIIISIFIFCLPILLLISGLLGRPIGSSFVNRRVEAHITLHYPELGLRVGRTRWGLMDSNYITRIYCQNDTRVFSNINFSNRRGISYNMGSFWARRLHIAHSPYVEEIFSEKLRRFDIFVWGLQAGELPIQSENITVMVHMELIVENLSPITLSEAYLRLYEILQHSEIPFTDYQLIFFLPDGRRAVQIELHTRHINEDLPLLIEYLQYNLDEHARYVDRERGTSYWAFVSY